MTDASSAGGVLARPRDARCVWESGRGAVARLGLAAAMQQQLEIGPSCVMAERG